MNTSAQHHPDAARSDLSERLPRTALVLGGGGSTGNAWLIGVVAGLFEAGLDVTGADLTIGTSAGSTAAAQLAGRAPNELFADILSAPTRRQTAPVGAARGGAPTRQATNHNHTESLTTIIGASDDAAEMRSRVGAWALEVDAASPRSAGWRTTVATRLPEPSWPSRRLLITAVDAQTGEPAVFDRHSGIDLVDAVAASCAGGFAYSIGGDRYIDGGYRRNENADLAAGYARVLVLSPFGGRSLHPEAWGMQLAAQIAELQRGGSRVETIVPDASARAMFAGGGNVMDLSLRPTAARTGFDQGRALAGHLTGFWH